jgi:hypothetical protein
MDLKQLTDTTGMPKQVVPLLAAGAGAWVAQLVVFLLIRNANLNGSIILSWAAGTLGVIGAILTASGVALATATWWQRSRTTTPLVEHNGDLP